MDWSEKIQERRDQEAVCGEEARYQATQYGSVETGAKPIEEIVKAMILKNSMRSLWFKHQVSWDFDKFENLSEVVNNVCISLGEDEESFAPYLNNKGYEVEVCLQ